ncbi:MAG: tRNA epoxyqueuosine(34) reductase QueG [Bacteroidota bacterium]|jgi:epoxyqueuosine reductase
MNLIAQRRSQQLKGWAKDLGFLGCGISASGFLEEEAPRLESWLKNGHHGKMTYMERYFDERLDTRKLVSGSQSVVSLLYNYFPQETLQAADVKIAKYAYGEDYHFVIKDKLKILLNTMEANWGKVDGRCFVDSAPILEKAWAAKSGLGWIGKNANLIQKQVGSFFFLAELIIDVALEQDGPTTEHCGTCTKCIDACPTEAIVQPHVVDGSKCISYFTIELKDSIPQSYKGQWSDWAFGCDICQDVCPWNRFAKSHDEGRFQPNETILSKSQKDWMQTTEEEFKKLTKGTPLERAKWSGMIKNIQHLRP